MLHVSWLLIWLYPSYLLLALVSSRRGAHDIPALILWLETECSSSSRKQKVKWEGSSPDVTENAQPMQCYVLLSLQL
jgi:hypothetical protein